MKYLSLWSLLLVACCSCSDTRVAAQRKVFDPGPIFSFDMERTGSSAYKLEEHSRLRERMVQQSPDIAPPTLEWKTLGTPPKWATELVLKKVEDAVQFEGIVEFGAENIQAWDSDGNPSENLRNMAIKELDNTPENRSFKSKYGWRTLVALFRAPQNITGPLPREKFTFNFEQLGGASPFAVGPKLDSDKYTRKGVAFLAKKDSKSASIPFFAATSWFSGPFSPLVGNVVRGQNVELKVSRVENLSPEDRERARRMARYELHSKVVFECIQSSLSSSAYPPYVASYIIPKPNESLTYNVERVNGAGYIFLKEYRQDMSEQEYMSMQSGQPPSAMFTTAPVSGQPVELWRNFKTESERDFFLIENAVVHLEVQVPLHGFRR